MPATALDKNTALVVIDLQRGIAALPTLRPFGDIVADTVRLADAFRRAKRPVVLVTVGFSPDGGDALRPRADVPPRGAMPPEASELVPELAGHAGDLHVRKRQWSAFYGTDLDLQLRRRGVTGIVLAGVATSIGVDTTARAAYERGYNLTFASDAMTDLDATAEQVSLTKIFPRIGQVDTTDAVLKLV